MCLLPRSVLRPAQRWLWSAERGEESPAVRRLDPPPAEVVSQSNLTCVDYADAFEVSTGTTGEDAEAWARLFLEGARLRVRLALLTAWTSLGLRLDPRPGPGRILGWRLDVRETDRVVLRASSLVGMEAELLILRRPESLLFSTLVRTESRAAQAIWPRVVPSHLRVVASVLAQARVPSHQP